MPIMFSSENETVKSINSRILSASNATSLLPGIVGDLKNILSCEAIALFLVDREHKQLVSLNHISNKVSQIRVDMSPKTPVGYVTSYGKALHISDKISKAELAMYNPSMTVSSSLDKHLKLKTKSMMVIPLPFHQKLIGAIEIINKRDDQKFTTSDFNISKELAHPLGLLVSKIIDESGTTSTLSSPSDPQQKLFKIINAIHSAKNVDEILIELKLSILELFNVSLVTIYTVDTNKNEIYSKLKSGDAVNEIRVPISSSSVAGYVAMSQKMVMVENVNDPKQLKRFHPDLSFDSSWDKKSGFRTKSMLVWPLIHKGGFMGVIQLINKKGIGKFDEYDQKNAQMISETLALAFFNQTKFIHQKPTKFTYLTNNGIITERELTEAIGKARRNQMDIETILLDELKVTRKDLGKSLEQFYKVSYLGYNSSMVLAQSVFEGLNLSFLLKNFWVPVEKTGNKVVVLIDNPFNKDKIQNIKLIFPKKKVELKVGLKTDIRDFLNSTIPDNDEGSVFVDEMSDLLHALKSEKEDTLIEVAAEDNDLNAISEEDSTIVKLVNKILIDAYDQGVSDIHIEPGVGKDNMEVRYRIDGSCRVIQEIPPIYKKAVISRLKIMARLDIAERRMPQDGKIKMKYGKKEIEYRVATCPTVGGNEDAVLRILAASKPIPLDNMNFTRRNLELIKKAATKPYGLILAVGPTGSGKTTTLHSALGHINTKDKKIWTAEDPVEITQKGLRQVQMLPKIGLDFARAMRAFLRGDPDVIMVGEMRDVETCSIGLEASLTGHLVFSTLHTNSAPETITRLLDLGMNPLNFADALLLIIAQRLVRTLCKECKEDYHPSQKEFEILAREYGIEEFRKLGVQYTDDLQLKRPVGCDKCNDTGYSGRTGLHEVLEGTDEIKRMIMQKDLVEEIRRHAIKEGMTTLKQDGILKILKGDCDLKQVLAVCIV